MTAVLPHIVVLAMVRAPVLFRFLQGVTRNEFMLSNGTSAMWTLLVS